MDDSYTIHDNICRPFHKKCHPKSYHSDIKFHMTLQIIFTVASHIMQEATFKHPIFTPFQGIAVLSAAAETSGRLKLYWLPRSIEPSMKLLK